MSPHGAGLAQSPTPTLNLALSLSLSLALTLTRTRGRFDSSARYGSVLLDDGLHAKVSDFGVAKRNGNPSLPEPPQHSFDTHTRGCGTMRYMAPEVLLSAGEYSFPCDVYSFGMLLWELTHDKVVFGGLSGSEVSTRVVERGQRPPLELPPSLAAIGPLITSCWQSDPEARPTMLACADELLRLVMIGVPPRPSPNPSSAQSSSTPEPPASSSHDPKLSQDSRNGESSISAVPVCHSENSNTATPACYSENSNTAKVAHGVCVAPEASMTPPWLFEPLL